MIFYPCKPPYCKCSTFPFKNFEGIITDHWLIIKHRNTCINWPKIMKLLLIEVNSKKIITYLPTTSQTFTKRSRNRTAIIKTSRCIWKQRAVSDRSMLSTGAHASSLSLVSRSSTVAAASCVEEAVKHTINKDMKKIWRMNFYF